MNKKWRFAWFDLVSNTFHLNFFVILLQFCEFFLFFYFFIFCKEREFSKHVTAFVLPQNLT